MQGQAGEKNRALFHSSSVEPIISATLERISTLYKLEKIDTEFTNWFNIF